MIREAWEYRVCLQDYDTNFFDLAYSKMWRPESSARLVHLREELMGSQLFTLYPCIVGQYNNGDLKGLVPFKSCDLFRAVILDFNIYTQVSQCAPSNATPHSVLYNV